MQSLSGEEVMASNHSLTPLPNMLYSKVSTLS